MSSEQDQQILALAILGLSAVAKKKSRKRKMWQRKWLQRREQLGCFKNLMRELALEVIYFFII